MGFSIHERRRLGRTGLAVSPIGLGGVYLGVLNADWDTAQDVAVDCVLQALKAGVNLIDTAADYQGPKSEEAIGLALRAYCRDCGGRREDVVVCTKTDTRTTHDFSCDATMRCVEHSLKTLQLDYLDVFCLHDPLDFELDIALGPGGAVEALKGLKAQGVIKAIGLGVRQHAFHERCIRTGDFDMCLTYRDYNLVNQSIAQQILPLAQQYDVGILNGTPVIRGLLAGGDPLIAAQRKPMYVEPPYDNPYIYAPEEVQLARRMWEFANAHGIGLLALNLQYCLKERRIASTVLGARTAEHILSDVAAISADIPDGVWQEFHDEFGL